MKLPLVLLSSSFSPFLLFSLYILSFLHSFFSSFPFTPCTAAISLSQLHPVLPLAVDIYSHMHCFIDDSILDDRDINKTWWRGHCGVYLVEKHDSEKFKIENDKYHLGILDIWLFPLIKERFLFPFCNKEI